MMEGLEIVELRHLQSFDAVASERQFTRGAERLHLAQQAVSQQIRQLEQVLGVPLFVRTTRHVELTPEGSALHGEVVGVLGELADACEEARALAAEIPKTVRLAYTPVYAAETKRLLDACRQPDGATRITAIELWTPEAIRGVASERYDAAVAFCPDVPAGLSAVPVGHEDAVGAVLHADDELAASDRVTPAALIDHILLICPRDLSPTFFDAIVSICRPPGDAGRLCEIEMFSRNYSADISNHPAFVTEKAFSVLAESDAPLLPPHLTWRPIEPCRTLRPSLVWRRADGSSAVRGVVSAAEQLFGTMS